jgi:hypothetical protein
LIDQDIWEICFEEKIRMHLFIWVFCLSEEQKLHALPLKKIYNCNVLCVDLRSRAPIMGVISGVGLEVRAKGITEEIEAVVGARRLTRMVDGVRKPSGWCTPTDPFFRSLKKTLSLRIYI